MCLGNGFAFAAVAREVLTEDSSRIVCIVWSITCH